jgi:hypothetical protein
MTAVNTYKIVEDALCGIINSIFSDSVSCQKEFEPDKVACRAICIAAVRDALTDQNGLRTTTVVYKEMCAKRSDAISNASKFETYMNSIHGKTLQSGLDIHLELQYITMPIKTMVGSKVSYFYSASIKMVTN